MQWSPLILLTMKHFVKYKSQLAMYVHSIILYVRMYSHTQVQLYHYVSSKYYFTNLSDV